MTRIEDIFIALCKTSSNKYILVQQTLDYSIAVNKQPVLSGTTASLRLPSFYTNLCAP